MLHSYDTKTICKLAAILVDVNNPPKYNLSYQEILEQNPNINNDIKEILQNVILMNINMTLAEHEISPLTEGSELRLQAMRDVYKVFKDSGFNKKDFAVLIKSVFNSIVNVYQKMLQEHLPKNIPMQLRLIIEKEAINAIQEDVKYVIESYVDKPI